LLYKRHARQNKAQFQYIQFAMTEIREIFAKIKSYIFLSFKQDKNRSLLWWQFRDGQQARRKKAQCRGGNFAMVTICEILRKLISTFFWTPRRKKAKCHDGNFAMVTIREILQKLISIFFWTSSKTKESEGSWWQFRNGQHSRNFAKINFDFFLNAK